MKGFKHRGSLPDVNVFRLGQLENTAPEAATFRIPAEERRWCRVEIGGGRPGARAALSALFTVRPSLVVRQCGVLL